MTKECRLCQKCGEQFARSSRGRPSLDEMGREVDRCRNCQRDRRYEINREWNRVRYKLLKERGRCIRCIDRKASPGKTMCRGCLRKQADANREKYTEQVKTNEN